MGEQPTTPPPPPPGPQSKVEGPARKSWWRRPWGIALIVFLAIVIIGGLAGAWDEDDDPDETAANIGDEIVEEPESEAEPETEPDSQPDEQDEAGEADESEQMDWAELYGHFDVAPETFVERWNDAIAEFGMGYAMEPLVFEHEQMFMDAARQDADGWAQIEAVRHPDGPLATFAIYAEPTTAEQGADMIAMMTAAIHAATSLDPEAAFEFVESELGMTEANVDPDDHMEEGAVDGVHVEVDAFSGMWDLHLSRDRG